MLICSQCDGIGVTVNGAGISETCDDCDGKGKVQDHRDPEEIAVDPMLLGNFALVCGQCDTLIWFHGSEEQREQMIEDLRECDAMVCPRCSQANWIPDDWRVMLND